MRKINGVVFIVAGVINLISGIITLKKDRVLGLMLICASWPWITCGLISLDKYNL